jgi:hypothetical protein
MKKRNRIALITGFFYPFLIIFLFSRTGRGVCSLYSVSAWEYIILGLAIFLTLSYAFSWFRGVKSNLKAALFFLSLLVFTSLEVFIIAVLINFHCWTF